MVYTVEESLNILESSSDPFEKASVLNSLHKDYDLPIKDIASKLNKSSSYVCNMIRLLKIPDLVRDGFYSNMISLTHLAILARLKKSEDIISAYDEVLKHSFSCPQTEEYVREKLYGIIADGEYANSEIYQQIKKKFGSLDARLTVKIVQSRIRLRILLEAKGNVNETNEVLGKLLRDVKRK